MSEEQANQKARFMSNLLTTVLGLVLFGIIAGTVNSYLKTEDNTKRVAEMEVILKSKLNRDELVNFKDYMKSEFSHINKRLDDIRGK